MSEFSDQRNKIAFLIVLVALGVFLFRIRLPQAVRHSQARNLMGTVIQVDLCSRQLQSERIELAYEQLWQRLEDISWRMNVYDPRSEVTKVNNSASSPVKISADTYHVYNRSQYFSNTTHGAFDITVRPLIELWKNAESENTLPSTEDIARVKSITGSDKIQLMDDNVIQVVHKETKTDLGGIAKGYAIDEVARILRSHRLNNFYIDAGGDIYVGGKNCKGRKWQIGIRDPRDQTRIIDIIALKDQAIATSGNYEQFFEIQGKRYSHIIDPATGYPQEGSISATVIAPSAEDADALATALTVLDPKKGIKLMNSLGYNFKSLTITLDTSTNKLNRHASRWFNDLIQ